MVSPPRDPVREALRREDRKFRLFLILAILVLGSMFVQCSRSLKAELRDAQLNPYYLRA